MSDVSVFDASGVERVRVGQIGTATAPDYGIKITSADGSTVIIDGTSDVFKIVASGTMTKVFPSAGTFDFSLVTLTALGLYTIPPAGVFMVTDDQTQDNRFGSIKQDNTITGHVQWSTQGATVIGGTPPDYVSVVLATDSLLVNPGTTAKMKYFVLAEAAF